MTNKTLFWSFYVRFCAFCASLRLTRTVFSQPIRSLPTYQVGPCNPWLIKDLRENKILYACRETITDVMSALQIHLFMQNKANFKKVKLNVTKVLAKDYDQMDTWSIRKTKPIQSQLKPIQSQSNPIKANKTPKQTQYKAKQSQYNAHALGMDQKTRQETVSYSQNGEYRYNYRCKLNKRTIL
ncbi:MAG: hypothetical protein ACYSU3_20600 [Planctomycetota bacterium]|jgi:hypothetical protein